jgi:excinuclease ABC subunit C
LRPLDASKEFFDRIPTGPGVYIMKDGGGSVIYVGKAKNLRARVRQYFRPGSDDSRAFIATGLLGKNLAAVDTMVVENEKEALLLENHLIKEHQPRFNVKLRDDKQYLVLRIDPQKKYPRVEVVRNIQDDDARYFGPYHSATSARQTLRTINRYFQLRTCTDHVLATRKRVCLQFQIKRCPGPCVYPVDEALYAEQVEDVMMFLAGKNDELVPRLRERMLERAQNEDFEIAAQLRDSLAAVEKVLARQDVVQEGFVDQDVFGFFREDDAVEAVVMFIRGGKLQGTRSFRQREQEFPDSTVATNFVQQYYAMGTFVPDEVLVPVDLEDVTVLEDWLSSLRGKRVKILSPKRGQRVRLLSLAKKNAQASAIARATGEEDALSSLGKLKTRLGLRRLPRRIECIDIAHIQGTETVASMVVFMDGKAERSLYRKFRIKSVKNDDFAAIYEVVSRRFKRAIEKREPAWTAPDLLVIDGGKGQLNSAIAAMTDLKLPTDGEFAIDVIGLAKERTTETGGDRPDRVFLANQKDPIELNRNSAELFVLARLRDEAHRFANTFHQKSRRKSTLRSALDDIPGIGPKRRRLLLRHFGSINGIRKATVDEIAALPGMTRKAAETVLAVLNA